jgi:hypothetical protein
MNEEKMEETSRCHFDLGPLLEAVVGNVLSNEQYGEIVAVYFHESDQLGILSSEKWTEP